MPLQFILGSSGSGKSRYLYETVIRESLAAPKENFLVLVPEQFTMEIQRNLTELHPRKGILNIDVLSFQRLALRVLEDLGADRRRVLEETGKNLVIRRCAMEHKKELTLLGGSMEKNGYISQVKSMISELAQYRIEPEQMDRILEGLEGQPRLYYKWKDIGILYQAFQERMAKDYVTAEELLEVLDRLQESAKGMKNLEEWEAYIEEYTRKLAEQAKKQETKKEGVVISTLHAVKGLEYDKVYIMNVNEGSIPYKKAVLEDALEEERRLFYVGMTRAKKELMLCYVRRQYEKERDPSRFLEETGL